MSELAPNKYTHQKKKVFVNCWHGQQASLLLPKVDQYFRKLHLYWLNNEIKDEIYTNLKSQWTDATENFNSFLSNIGDVVRQDNNFKKFSNVEVEKELDIENMTVEQIKEYKRDQRKNKRKQKKQLIQHFRSAGAKEKEFSLASIQGVDFVSIVIDTDKVFRILNSAVLSRKISEESMKKVSQEFTRHYNSLIKVLQDISVYINKMELKNSMNENKDSAW